MKIMNLEKLVPVQRRSPKGKFDVLRQDLSLELGAQTDAAPELGGHPFAVERAIIPPGKQNFPVHAHAAQWEFYLIESGYGVLRTPHGDSPVGKGDFFMSVPGHAHALCNTSETEELIYLVIANNPMADVVHYPASQKWLAKPGRHCFRTTIDYYDREE